MHDGNQEWSWVSEDGIEHAVSESELAFALSAEEIAPYTLVWKRGWTDWLPAMQVAELQWALPPGRADGPRKAPISESGRRRPPPLELYPQFKQRSGDLVAGRVSPHQEALASSPSTATASSPAPRRETTPDLARITSHDRSSMGFTREDEEEQTRQIDGEELERARLETLLEIELEEAGEFEGQREALGSEPQLRGVDRSPRAPQVVNNAREASIRLTAPPSNPRLASVLGSYPSMSPPPPMAAPFGSQGSRPSLAPSPSAPASHPLTHPPTSPTTESKSRLPIVAILSALALGALAALWLRFGRPPAAPPLKVAAPALGSANAGQPRPLQCRLGRPGSMLAEWAYPKIEPTFARAPGSEKLAVGYAQTSRYAVGLLLDPASLRAEKVFSEFQNSPLLSDVPLTSSPQLAFRPTRAAATLQSSTTIDGNVPFTFGWTREGFAVRRDTDSVDQIQWRDAYTTANVPSVGKLTEDTFAFALRAGGERGSVLAGKIRSSGDAQGDLRTLKLPEGRVGLPALRVGNNHVLLTVTLGATELRGDVYLAHSRKPDLPSQARSVLHVAEGVFSPEAVELTDGTFLLQFARGEPGNQQIVAQVYDFELNKLGPEFVVSPGDLDAHAGALWTYGSYVLSLYMVRTDQAYALWATRIDCS